MLKSTQKIKELREKLGYNRNQFAKFLGVHNSFIYSYENGKIGIGRKFIMKLKSKIPNLNEAWFFNDEAEMFSPPPSTPQRREANNKIKEIKVYTRVAAGEPMVNWEQETESFYIRHPALEKIHGELFGFTVKGDSMEPRLYEDDIIITRRVKPPELPHDGDYIVSIFHDGREANVKIFNWVNQSKGEFILSSLNKKYAPMFHSLKETRYMFKVITFLSFNI